MNAHPTDRTLHAYGLGKLDDAAAESLDFHLESCSDCRQRVAAITSDSFLGRLRDAQARTEPPPPVVSSTTGQSGRADQRRSPMASATGTLPPGLADHSDYEVLRELGRGGMGVVYLAENKLMGRKEVLKVVSGQLINRPGVFDRFVREIRNAAQLHHSSIVTAYSALRIGETLVLSMEYVEGFDLSRVVKAKGPLPVAHACQYVHQAALGLQHAHEHGMVHRDIKPSNIMLARQGNRSVIKILDFGLARVEREQDGAGTLTHAGQLLGTPAYIAPEQISDPRRADIRADIYSLGCTFYYLLVGNPPFQGANLYDILQAHQSMEAAPLNLARPDVPVQLAIVVATMMAKEPERRFGTPQEVAQALAPFLKKDKAVAIGSSPVASATDSAIRPELSRADGWGDAVAAANVVAAPTPSPQRTAGSMPSGPGLETLIEVDPEDDLSTEVRALREARESRAWLWPVAACGGALLLGLAVFVGMKIEASKTPASLIQATTPAAPGRKATDPLATRSSEPPPVTKEPPWTPDIPTAPASAPTRLATGPVGATKDTTKGPGKSNEPPRMETSLARAEPKEPSPDRNLDAAKKGPKPDPEPAPEPDSPEAVLAKRGLNKKVEAGKVYLVVETEREFARGLPPVRVAMNELLGASSVLAAALDVEFTVQQLDIWITNLRYEIQGLNAQIVNIANDPPGKVLKAQIAYLIRQNEVELLNARRDFDIAKKQQVGPAKMQALEDNFAKRRDEFMAAAAALKPTYQRLLSEYRELGKDEEVERMRRLHGERNKVKVQLGPSASVQSKVRSIMDVLEQYTSDPEGLRRTKQSTRLKGRDGPKPKSRKDE